MQCVTNTFKLTNVKPFNQIPGPKPLPIIGNVWRYLPVIGNYDIAKPVDNGKKNLSDYGPIVKEKLYGNTYLVHLFDPKDIETLFRNEIKYPERRSHRAMKKIRLDKPNIFCSGGIFPENGPEWYRIRKTIQGLLMTPELVNQYVQECDIIGQDLVKYIYSIRDVHKDIDDFFQILYFWAIENIIKITLNIRIGSFTTETGKLSDINYFIKRAHDAEDAIMKLEVGSLDLWRFINTPTYNKLSSAISDMSAYTSNWLQLGKECLTKSFDIKANHSVLHHLVAKEKCDDKDINGIIFDLIFAGLDTTAFVAGFTLYHLALNQSIQEKVYQEVKTFLPTKNSLITLQVLNSLQYVKACVKETMRIKPVSIGTGRLTTKPIIIRDYYIPEKTMIITQNQVACLQEHIFNEPNLYLPERWLRSASNDNLTKPQSSSTQFAYLPFGFGARMCVGRRISEIELHTTIARIIRNYKIEYCGPEIGLKYALINHPDKAMKLKFVERP